LRRLGSQNRKTRRKGLTMTEIQSLWFDRIREAGGMVMTLREGHAPVYNLLTDATRVPSQTAMALIRGGFMRGEGDGLLHGISQVYREAKSA
jgi:hypothetical protein